VESLIKSHEETGFVDQPAYEAAAEMVINNAEFQSGQTVAHYKVLSLLGEGGMGKVYLAQDTKLNRKVALKFLPLRLAGNQDHMRRFTQEAKSAAALHHPNIAQIFEIGDSEDAHYIAMEFVEGETLRELISRRKLEIKKAVELAAQVASGLATAHKAGVIHRDIKPDNLIVTAGGQIKILDFGLAKLVERQRPAAGASHLTTMQMPSSSHNETLPGVILGTVSYMSPEQARGEKLDHRTDIFSLGVVLYEMATGERPFKGKSVIDTLHAIINHEPPPVVKLNSQTPPELADLLGKALAKEPAERYQHAGDFELDLRRLKKGIESNTLISTQSRTLALPEKAGRQRVLSLTVIGLILVLGLIGAGWMLRGFNRTTSAGWSTAGTVATQLTNYGGSESSAALSPDGRSFVFVSEHGGTPDLWLRQIAGGEPVRLTNDPAEEADPIYAPDGETIYFARIDGTGPSIWRIGALGGQARRIVGSARKPAPSPDGRSLAYLAPDSDGTGDTLVVSGLDGSATRTLARSFTGGDLNGRAAWSPDGRWLAYNRWELFAPFNLFVSDVNSGKERQVTQFTKSQEGVETQTWLPDNRHLIVSFTQSTFFQSDLGLLDIQDGSISRLTLNVARGFGSLSVSADGSRLIATANQTQREVWKVPLGPDPEANGRAAVRVLDSSQDPMWTFVSRDGRTLLFNNATTGTRNLWTVPLDHSAPPRQITTIAGDNVMHSSLSPDGSRAAFVSRATGYSEVWTQNVDGSDLRQLTNDQAAVAWPVWSPDGEWIVFASLRGRQWETWRVRAAGGPDEKIMNGFFRGDWIREPDGDGTTIVSSVVGSGIRLIDFERRTVTWEEHFAGGGIGLPMFSPDGRFISLPRHESRDRDAIWLYETATGKGRLAVRFPEPFKMVFRACWVDNGKALIVNRHQTTSHIVLFDRFWIKEHAP
jgi:eukaryotic-like serine/threonine-protein kinase